MQGRRLLAITVVTGALVFGRARRGSGPGAHLEEPRHVLRGQYRVLQSVPHRRDPARRSDPELPVGDARAPHRAGGRLPREPPERRRAVSPPLQADPRLPLPHRSFARRHRHAGDRGSAWLPRAAAGHPAGHHPAGRVRRAVAGAARRGRRGGLPQLAAAQYVERARGVRLRAAAARRPAALAADRDAGARAAPRRSALHRRRAGRQQPGPRARRAGARRSCRSSAAARSACSSC